MFDNLIPRRLKIKFVGVEKQTKFFKHRVISGKVPKLCSGVQMPTEILLSILTNLVLQFLTFTQILGFPGFFSTALNRN